MRTLTLLRLAERLAISLEGGLLAGRGPIDLGDGPLPDAERATRIVLADVEALVATVDDGPIARAQHWESVERQLERLSHLSDDEVVDVVVRLRRGLERAERRFAQPLSTLDEAQEHPRRIQRGQHRDVLHEIVETAIGVTGAEMGLLQLRDRATPPANATSSRVGPERQSQQERCNR